MQRSGFFRFASPSQLHRALLAVAPITLAMAAVAQSTSGVIAGTAKDSTGALVPNATVTLQNRGSGYSRTVTADAAGRFTFTNIPFDEYQLSAMGAGLQASAKRVRVSSAVPLAVDVTLAVVGSSTTVDVEATPDLTESDPTFHTDVDRAMISHLPTEGASSELSSIVTQLTPGVAADSNGLLHGLGDHNEVSFSVDGQPITDQQSKVFSNQLPADAVQSFEVIEGAPPAEYGDKTSLVVVVTTRSGQGITKPTGEVSFSYGSFGTSHLLANMAWGGPKWGNFITGSGLESGRFLDAPEFVVYHDKGNEENFFDRIDGQFSDVSSMHLNLQYTRSLFQTPNSYDTQYGFQQQGLTTGATDQRSKIETYLFAPTYTRVLSSAAVLNFAPYIRHDSYRYLPSANLLNDLGPIQQESVGQQRSLTNAGVRSDVSWTLGHNSLKFGGMYQQTFLRENDVLGLVDSNLNAPCLDVNGNPANVGPNQCATVNASSFSANPNYSPVLAPYDLTRGGGTYIWHGQTDVKQLALYAQDQLTAGNWQFNFGVRGDFYNGLAIDRQPEPRAGLSYNVKKTGTVLRLSYARTQETPFNENLVLSAHGCLDPVLNAVFTATAGYCNPAPFRPGFRNEFHAGFSQAIGSHLVVNGEWISKYTHNGYDFSVLGATPITFPIEWHNSKIPGYTASATLADVKGLTARVVFSSVAARFFNPQIGGVGATVATGGSTLPFRIDHDERANASTFIEYRVPRHKNLYYSLNWRYDSGLVAGSVPCYNATGANSGCTGFSTDANGNPLVNASGQPLINLSSLTADEQFQAGLTCDGVRATQTQGFTGCDAAGLTSKLVSIPGINQEDDDHNPPRISQRNLFDMEMGDDDLVHFSDRYHLGARLTAVNVTNKYALYNFLSTFSGTHYVTPRTVTGEIAFRF
ncbi:TonB-dependent receptor [Terriglobus aquaticus]|uniref:Carboxypeptidase regulatory-like domain-containing protein n=1 Tax=Terriglobus aquaticus TaxID=940139 RepID=A0ABW9KH60_9BACT|nr:TonB-dependent receptor [Terriglobus aquaticus]